MYAIVAVISAFIRQFYLPNPFECFGNYSFIINWVAEPIIHFVAFKLVGVFYQKGSLPALGSILYLIMYALITGILWVMGLFSFAWWWVLFVVFIVIVVLNGLAWIKRRFFRWLD